MPSFSRPAVSDDNPCSESLFKTMKYRPHYPKTPFDHLLAARQWVGTFVRGYNDEQRHSAIGFVTPSQRHDRQNGALLRKRSEIYEAAKAMHPERWSSSTRNWKPVLVVHLNPEKKAADAVKPEEKNLDLKRQLNYDI